MESVNTILVMVRIVELFIAGVSLILGFRIYSFFPKRRLNRVTALALVGVCVLAFIEYEITFITASNVIGVISVWHTALSATIAFFAAWASKLFAGQSPQIPKMLSRLLLGILAVFYLVILFGLFVLKIPPDIDLVLNESGFWTYIYASEGAFVFIVQLYYSFGVLLMSFYYYLAYRGASGRRERRWKLTLFIAFTAIPLMATFLLIFNINEDSRGNYVTSPIFGAGVYALSWIFSNFRLFEISPRTAIDQILDSISNLTLIVDQDLNIRFGNKALLARLSMHIDPIHQYTLPHLLSQIKLPDREKHLAAIQDLHHEDKYIADLSLNWEGHKQFFQAVVTPAYNSRKQKVGYVIVATDLTFNKETELQLRNYARELEQSNRELESIAYVASHDLKSPLRNINSFVGLVNRKLQGSEDSELKEYLRFISTNTRQMHQLVHDIMEFSRIKRTQRLNVQIDLNYVVRVIRENLQQELSHQQGKINCPEVLPTVFSNQSMMNQLFQNLISNGLKYNKSTQPEIRITYQEQAEWYEFSIIDNGIGIDPRFREQIFGMFKRLHTQDKFEGTGIGLAICRKIVELHGGEIWLASANGTGSTFQFTLPKSAVEKRAT